MLHGVSESLLLNGKHQFFSYIMERTSCIQWNDDDVPFVLNQHAYLDLYSTSSLKQQSLYYAEIVKIVTSPSS
jgi:hypothetical protein